MERSRCAKPRFLDGANLEQVLLSATLVCIVALGQGLIIIARQIDLSVGAMVATSPFVAAEWLSRDPILAFAGLQDHWIEPATKEETLSCTVIVSGASAWMTPYHDRMPVLLRAEDFEAWLNGSLVADGLGPAAESALREWPVSRRVNRTGVDDDPTIIEKVDAA